jgi:hypothetical protein
MEIVKCKRGDEYPANDGRKVWFIIYETSSFLVKNIIKQDVI